MGTIELYIYKLYRNYIYKNIEIIQKFSAQQATVKKRMGTSGNYRTIYKNYIEIIYINKYRNYIQIFCVASYSEEENGNIWEL